MCNARSAHRCLWCQSTSYCSISCQEKDFTTHKLLCQQIPSFPPRPSTEHVRAIFFPETECLPQLTWAKYESGVDNFDGKRWTRLITDSYLGYEEPKKGRVRIEANPLRSETFGTGFKHGNLQRDGHCVTMVYRASGNPCLNESILTSLRPPGVEQSPLRGPVLAVRERPGKLYEDIAMSDFRHLVDYLASFHLTRLPAEPYTRPIGPVHRVLIRCWGEAQHNSGVSFESADISTVGCAPGDNGVISQISKLLGMPLRLRKCAINGFFEDVTNPNASMLMLMLNPERKDWGMPSVH